MVTVTPFIIMAGPVIIGGPGGATITDNGVLQNPLTRTLFVIVNCRYYWLICSI
jgi:hypothetical protein